MSTNLNSPTWSVARVIVYGVVVGAVFLVVQVAVMVAILVADLVRTPELNIQDWAEKAGSNGVLLSLTVIASSLVCVPLLRLLVGHRDTAPWRLLGIKRVDAGSLVRCALALVAFVAVTDATNVTLGRPLVPQFMVDAYATSASPVLLLIAVAVAAPVFEELFFRGFILGALESSGVSALRAAVVASVSWAGIHLQYDLFDMVTIFFMGALLAFVRKQTGSVVPCLMMHALANVIAFVETVLLTELPRGV